MSDLIDNLERAMRRYMLRAMPPDPTGALAAMNCGDLLHVYGSWRRRFVPPRPRHICLSREILSSPYRQKYGPVLAAIVEAIAKGEDINPHLSANTRHAYRPGLAPLLAHKRQDRDLLLADWGIHHLHLSKAPHPRLPGYTDRSDEVLFVAFRDDHAYVIEIYPHPQHHNWAQKAILEIAVRNWPDGQVIDRPFADVRLASPEPDDEARLELRRAGVNTAYEIDGQVYMPLGQTTAGTPIVVSRHVMRVMAILDHYRRNGDELRALLARHDDGADASWEPHVADDAAGFVKGRRGVAIAELAAAEYRRV